MRVNIFVRGALFPHWTRKRSGGVVASVSVGVPWTGRVGPSGLVWTGCRERVGLDALDRTSRPEWVGPDGLSRACRLGCLGPSEPTRMGWSVHGLDSFILVRDGRSLPAFPLRFGPLPSVLCSAGTSLHPGVAFLCFGLLPSVLCFAVSYASPAPPCTRALPSCASDCCLPCFVSLSPMPRPFLLCLARSSYASPVPPCTQVVASCSPRPASLSPRPRSFLFFGPLFPALRPALSYTLLHSAPSCSFAHAFLRFGPLSLALLTLPALLPVQKKTPEGLAFGGFRLLSVANYFARAFRLTSLAALSASFGFFEMALLSCASAAVRSPSLTAMTARR